MESITNSKSSISWVGFKTILLSCMANQRELKKGRVEHKEIEVYWIFWVYRLLIVNDDLLQLSFCFLCLKIPGTISFNDLFKICAKRVRIWSYSGPYFPAFGVNMERYGVSLRIHSKCRKIRTRITPNKNTFYARKDKIYKAIQKIKLNWM